MEQEFIDTYDAAAEMGISRMTLYRLMAQFGIKRYKFPGKRRTMIRRSDLAKLRQPQELDGSEGKSLAAA